MIITIEDLKKLNACEEELCWFAKKYPTGEALLEDIIRDIPVGEADWAAWLLYELGKTCPDDRYTPAIGEALIKTGDAYWLERAGAEWPEDRYIPEIGEALAKSGEVERLEWAEEFWPKARWEALVKTGNVDWLGWAEEYWPKANREALDR